MEFPSLTTYLAHPEKKEKKVLSKRTALWGDVLSESGSG